MHPTAAVIVFATLASMAAGQPAAPAGARFSGRLIVRLKPGAAPALAGAAVVKAYPEVREVVVAVPPGETEASLAAKLLAAGSAEYAHPDWVVPPAVVPNDPRYASQWHLPRMGLPAAWDITVGDPSVIVAFCDSGVDQAHPDLAAVLIPGYNSVDNLPQADGGNVSPTNDHGTQVAGCIGGIGNNAVGIAGVGWNLRLMPIRVTNLVSGNASLSEINEGARWAADHGAKVVNISYSGVSAPTNATTGRYLRDRGASCVWAAGNAAGIAGPFDIPELFVVGASDQSDGLASFSNSGPAMDLVAPGTGIVTTRVGNYGPADGTSFAAPLTAGVLALTRSVNPGWGPAQSEAAVARTARDLGPPGRDDTFGAGLVDAAAAVALARLARDSAVPPAAIDDRTTVTAGIAVDLDVLANDVDLNTGGPLSISAADTAFPGGWARVLPGAGPGGRDLLRITADAAFRGEAEVLYTARNAAGSTADAHVHLTVAAPPAWSTAQVVPLTSFFGDVRRIRAADFDGDGDLDLAVGQLSTLASIGLLRNEGGVFVPAGAVDLPTSGDIFDVADLNRDGRPDLVSGSFIAGQIAVALATGPFTFGPPSAFAAAGVGDLTVSTEEGPAFDANGDGIPDLAYTSTTANTAVVRLGNGQGGFAGAQSYSVGISPVLLRAANLAGDGRTDLLIGSTGGQSLGVLVGAANGSFAAVRTTSLGVDPADLAVLDADGDGRPDVAALCSGLLGQPAGVSVLTPAASGLLTLRARLGSPGDTPWRFAAADLNRDGLPDLTAVNKISVDRVFYPGGAGGLGDPLPPEGTGLLLLSCVRTADLSGDGVPDLVLGGQSLSGLLLGAVEVRINRTRRSCRADFNGDGFVDFFDYDAFITCFEGGGCPPARGADTNFDGFVDFFDYLTFVEVFEGGC